MDGLAAVDTRACCMHTVPKMWPPDWTANNSVFYRMGFVMKMRFGHPRPGAVQNLQEYHLPAREGNAGDRK